MSSIFVSKSHEGDVRRLAGYPVIDRKSYDLLVESDAFIHSPPRWWSKFMIDLRTCWAANSAVLKAPWVEASALPIIIQHLPTEEEPPVDPDSMLFRFTWLRATTPGDHGAQKAHRALNGEG